MNGELKKIKKKYGEGMAKFCRETFPLLLEIDGLLFNLLVDNFNPSHELYKDIVSNGLVSDFKNYIFGLVNNENEKKEESSKTPKELLSDAGYDLYKCKSESDIQKFKKYYAWDEKICTFKGGRLNKCIVFFAVKKDVDNIKRKDFKNPNRQDLYGTSVISIQFTREAPVILSIKNRYNHKVNNPDATFSNNLDNIIPGLSNSFEKEYGIVLNDKVTDDFEIPNYVKAKDGKYYKYNYEINNIYYCPDNIIINYGEVKKLPKEKYIILDYFVLDLQNKKLFLYDNYLEDSFVSSIPEIEKISILNKGDSKEIRIIPKDDNDLKTPTYFVNAKGFGYDPKMINNSVALEDVVITLDKSGRITHLVNNNILEIKDSFLRKDDSLVSAEFSKALKIGKYFLFKNTSLKELIVPKVLKIKSHCLSYNKSVEKLDLPNVLKIGDFFLHENEKLEEFVAPKLKVVGFRFLNNNNSLTNLNLPNLIKTSDLFLPSNDKMVNFYAPKLKKVSSGFFEKNKKIEYFHAPKVKSKKIISHFYTVI